MSDGWKYLLGYSPDMSVIGEFKHAKSRSLKYDFNGSGSGSFSNPIDDDLSRLIVPWRTCLIAQYDDDWKWSGPITTRNIDLQEGHVTVSAVGWFEKLMHLLIQAKVQYANEDAGEVAAMLLALANQIYDTRITLGTVEPTQPRTVTYDIDANIGQEIINLAEIESGYDWYVDSITRTLNIVKVRGQRREECKWIYIHGEGGNLKNVQENVDGTVMVNDIKPRGSGLSGIADDPVSQSYYDIVMQEAPSLSGVVDVNVLNAYANAEIVYRSNPRVTYSIFPKTDFDPSVTESTEFEVPKLFDDFDIGDTTFLTARRGFVDVTDQATRIFNVDLSIDDNSGMATINSLGTSLS